MMIESPIPPEPPVDVHGFAREIAASQRKSGTETL